MATVTIPRDSHRMADGIPSGAIGTPTASEPGPRPPLKARSANHGAIETIAFGKRKGAPEVQWDDSKDRKFARLYSISDADIDDLPVIMRDEKLKFEKRHAQNKSASNLGPRPNEMRSKDSEQMSERIEEMYNLKSFIKQIPTSYSSQKEVHNLGQYTFASLDEAAGGETKFNDDGETIIIDDRDRGLSYAEAIIEFAQDHTNTKGQNHSGMTTSDNHRCADPTPTKRTSYMSLLSLHRRMKERTTKGGRDLRQYSDETLKEYLFIKRRLSIGSLPSNRSFTSTSLSKRASSASHCSTLTQQSSSTIVSSQEGLTAEDIDVTHPHSVPLDMNTPPPTNPFSTVAGFHRLVSKSQLANGGKVAKQNLSSPQLITSTNTAYLLPSAKTTTLPGSTNSFSLKLNPNPNQIEGFPYIAPFIERLDADPERRATSHPEYFQPRSSTTTCRQMPGLEPSDRSLSTLDPLSQLTSTQDTDLITAYEQSSSQPSATPRAESTSEKALTSDDIGQQSLSKQPVCCFHLCRGDPRVEKCLVCQYGVPESHAHIRSIIERRRNISISAFSPPDSPEFYVTSVDEFGDRVVDQKSAMLLGVGSPEEFALSDTIDVGEVDEFGDTLLHLAASLGADTLILSGLITLGVDVCAKNAAGQTFMHVLNPTAFAGCDNDAPGLANISWLFDTLYSLNFNFNAQDDYGQTPMHVFTKHWVHSHTLLLALTSVHKPFTRIDKDNLSRDFLGRSIVSQLETHSSCRHPVFRDGQRRKRVKAWLLSQPDYNVFRTFHQQFEPTPPDLSPGEVIVHRHRRLRETIELSLSQFPGVEYVEYEGLNALHCLAESCISLNTNSQSQHDQNSNPQPKRKRKADTLLRRDYVIATITHLVKHSVNPNAYDSYGRTPLMAFIRHDLLQRPERKLLKEVLQLLIDSGACVHRRNRKNETALHLAMKFGRPSAVEVLLENYANIHARDRRGVGVLLTAQRAAAKAKHDAGLYARIITCMRIALENHPPCVLNPSAKQEWDYRLTGM